MSRYKRYPRYRDSGTEWIGQVPEGWEVLEIKRLSKVQRGASPRPIEDPKYFDMNGIFGWVRIGDVTSSDGELRETKQRLSTLGASLSVKLTPGSLFLSIAATVGKPCITAINACIHDGFVYFPQLQINPWWLFRVFECGTAFVGLGKLNTQLNLNTETVGVIPVPLPPRNEIPLILKFISTQAARIDALIAKKTRLIALLKEKRQALITHAVTKGLNPNAKMKDSGVEWIGQVPEGWEVVPSAWLFSEGKTRAYAGDQHLSATQKYGVIPLADYERLEERQVTHAILHHDQRKHVEPGDFVISMRSFEGGIEKVNARGCVRSSYVVLHAENSAAIDFFAFLFKSSSYIQGLQATSNFIRDGQDLNYGNFRQVKLPRPKLEEQRHIAEFLTTSINRIDQITVKTERSIALLQEKRSALITAAVTGKILVGDGA